MIFRNCVAESRSAEVSTENAVWVENAVTLLLGVIENCTQV